MATLTDTALISAKRFVICLKYCSGVRATRSLYTIFLKSEKMCAQYVDLRSHVAKIKQIKKERKKKKEIGQKERKKFEKKETNEYKVYLG